MRLKISIPGIEFRKANFYAGGKTIRGVFADQRVESDKIDSKKYIKYEVRHCDDDWTTACEISKTVIVNFMGTFICAKTNKDALDKYLDNDIITSIDKQEMEYLTEAGEIERSVIEIRESRLEIFEEDDDE